MIFVEKSVLKNWNAKIRVFGNCWESVKRGVLRAAHPRTPLQGEYPPTPVTAGNLKVGPGLNGQAMPTQFPHTKSLGISDHSTNLLSHCNLLQNSGQMKLLKVLNYYPSFPAHICDLSISYTIIPILLHLVTRQCGRGVDNAVSPWLKSRSPSVIFFLPFCCTK